MTIRRPRPPLADRAAQLPPPVGLRRGGHDRARRNTVFDLRRIAAAAAPPGDYKALVCLFLYGGNDGNNMIVPRGADYAAYAAARGALALPQASLLRAHPVEPLRATARRGGSTRASPGCSGLFDAARLARGRQRRAAGRAGHPRRVPGRHAPRCRRSSSRTATRRCTGRPRCPTSRRAPAGAGASPTCCTRSTRTPRSRCRCRSPATTPSRSATPSPSTRSRPTAASASARTTTGDHGRPTRRRTPIRRLLAQQLRQPLRARLPRRLPARARQPGPLLAGRAGRRAAAQPRCSRTPTSAASSR